MRRTLLFAAGLCAFVALGIGLPPTPRAVGGDAPPFAPRDPGGPKDPGAPKSPGTSKFELPAAAPFATGVVVRRDLEYAKGGERPLHLDLYSPSKPTPHAPFVLWIHGGGWVGGDKVPCPTVTMVLKGYVTASVEYRFSKEAVFPAQIEDCKAAVRWVRTNAEALGVDPSRIGVVGASAGGHLAALLGVASDCAALEGLGGCPGVSSAVAAVCDVCGPADLLEFDGHGSSIVAAEDDSLIAKLLGGPVSTRRELARQASPVSYATKDDPPFLIVHGDKDDLVPVDQARRLDAALSRAGVDSTLLVVKGAGHGTFGPDVSARIVLFFDRWLKNAKAPAPAPAPSAGGSPPAPAPPVSAPPGAAPTPTEPKPEGR